MCLPFENQVDAMYFQLFRTQTSSELSGFFDSVFWTRTVLQECHAERPVMHAVIALGALYKTLEKRSKSPPGSPSQTPDGVDGAVAHWQVAVGQYQNSVKALLNVNSRDQGSNRTRLIATVLLACFDSFAGDHEQAITQIQSGLGLLEQMRQERRMAFHTGSEEPVEPELIQMFTRLAIQAKSYDMAFHFPQPYVIRLTPATSEQPGSSPSDAGSPASALPEIPERFSSLIEARLAWDNLCERMIRFNERLFSYQSPDSPMGILPPHLTTYGLGFKQQIEQWAVAFEPLLASRNAPGVSSQEKTARAILKMFQLMGHILFLMTFSASEMHFDNFHLFFKAIVDLGMEVVGDEERRAAAKRCPNPQTCVHRDTYAAGPGEPMLGPEFTACHIKPSFSADLGIVPPLYVVATKCRNSLLRRQAIQLLRSSARREGMWDSELTARIAMWIASIEEDASEDAQKPGSQLQMQQPAPVPYIKTEDFSSQGAFAGSTDGGSGFSTRHSSHSPTPPPTGPANSATPSIKSESQTSVSGLDSPPPSASFGATSPLQPAYHRQTPDFAENVPLGPGGNARWDAEAAAMLKAQRRYAAAATMAMAGSVSPGGCGPAAVDSYSVVPEHRRVMVRAVRFSLRSRVAEIECGTRGLPAGAFDERARKTRIQW